MLEKIELGKPLSLDNKWGTLKDGTKITLFGGGIFIILAYTDPTKEEVRNIRSGVPAFSVISLNNIMFFSDEIRQTPVDRCSV